MKGLYEADPRHVEQLLYVAWTCRRVEARFTPGIRETDDCLVEEDDVGGGPVSGASSTLRVSDATLYRSGVPWCNYLAFDRPDIVFATKEM